MTPLLLALVVSASDPADIVEQHASIHVSGTAKSSLAPEKVDVFLTVQTEADTVEAAVTANEVKLNATLAAARALGIAAVDLQLSSVNVSQRDEYDTNNRPKGVKFMIRKELVVCLRTPSKLDALVVDVSKAKALVGSINFSSDKIAAADDELQLKAVENAKKRGEALAARAGAKLGRALRIRDAQQGPGRSMDAYSSGAGVSVGNAATGALSLTHSVEVDFELLDGAAK